MRVITQREVIQSVKRRFRIEFPRDEQEFEDGRTVGRIWNALSALDENTCSREDINRAICSMSGWADIRCEECENLCNAVVRFGAEPDYDVRWMDLCGDCLDKAKEALNICRDPIET